MQPCLNKKCEKPHIFHRIIKLALERLFRCPNLLKAPVYFGKRVSELPTGAIVFFPLIEGFLCCGLAGIVAHKVGQTTADTVNMDRLEDLIDRIEQNSVVKSVRSGKASADAHRTGEAQAAALLQEARLLKRSRFFCDIYIQKPLQRQLQRLANRLHKIVEAEKMRLSKHMGYLSAAEVDSISQRVDELKDVYWCLQVEILNNIKKIKDLLNHPAEVPTPSIIRIYREINAVFNSIDRLEVRGRDSAGISLIFGLDDDAYAVFQKRIADKNLLQALSDRLETQPLRNKSIGLHETKTGSGGKQMTIAMTYKVAAEVGNLGDNIAFLRSQIQNDMIFKILSVLDHAFYSILSHTRWASVGAITEANCHPVDNDIAESHKDPNGVIHVCLNGDIDNYRELKADYESKGNIICPETTTDTKIIPLQIEKHLGTGVGIEEAFRLAVSDFAGSHAIAMHTDLAPGKIFLAQKGSGQAIFIGIADDHYMPTSEVYGFVEETPLYLKMNGEKVIQGKDGPTQGQIFVLDQRTNGGLSGISTMYYDGTVIDLKDEDIKRTDITSRDIDRQDYSHYFLKEISESPVSVEKTILNRWKVKEGDPKNHVVSLDERSFPQSLGDAWANGRIRRVFFMGQGTAGVAALACANILSYYLDDAKIPVHALKASELSGFQLNESNLPDAMADCLIVAISQSGTTTDTNRTIDMVKEQGAHTLAIVNRRDSDITFKVDGVIYTSSGRDIEMSVASTKAFYSQIVAGAILSLHLAALRKRRSSEFITNEIRDLLQLPAHMRKVLDMREDIEASAKRLAVTKAYWAAVGSGPNKASADEIRIKLSELCYKTISSDYVEDKKHIDLSSEPLIIVCAAGTRETVIGDIVKDTAIFHAHKATPIVIANEGEDRFAPYAADMFFVPFVSEHFSPILNTLVGHVWGYYAALAINAGSKFVYRFREEIQKTIDDSGKNGLSLYELVLEKSFREKIVRFYEDFRRKKSSNRLPTAMGLEVVSDLTLLLKYLAGKLPIPDFELDFGKKGTALNMLNTLFECIGEAINFMARPVDAIKHQAKTVTVGTSRTREKLEGVLFEALDAYHLSVSRLTNKNIIVLRNLQNVVSAINGSILYKIGSLNLLGEPTEETTIEILEKRGILKSIPSRVENDCQLKGTKRIIVREGNVYIGKGRKDDRSILVIPVISDSPTSPNLNEHLVLLNISFKENIPLSDKVTALGGKYERIKNIVQESSVTWEDRHLELVETEDLFGRSSEKIGEFIVSQLE
jgi:glutamine---fructose-6-phosphate transaminase (isomerizing)